MRERILIVDIGGSAGDLPDTTPAATRYVNWLPQVSTAANIPAPGGFAVKALTDAVLLTWASVAGQSMRYGIESALDVNGQPGSWQVVTETDALRYTASVPDAAARWWRVRAISLGKAGAYTAPQRAVSISGAAVQQAVADAQAAADTAQSGVNSHAAELVHAQQERDRIAAESLQRDIQGGLDAAADAKNKADAAREAAYLRAQTLFGEAIAAAAADATIKANGARDVALARINTIESQVADILSADAHSTSKTYPAGDLVQHAGKLYRAKQVVPTGIAITNTAYWEYVGDYTSLGEAVSASIAQATENRTALQLERTRLNGIVARMPAGTDGLATQTMVLDEMSERLSADEALAGRTTVLESRAGNNEANIGVALARIAAEESARARDDEALSRRTGVVEARMPAGDGELATAARVASVEQAASSANQATADRATQLETRAGEMQAAITGLEHAASNDRQSAAQRMDTMQADINDRATAGAVDAVTVRVNKLGGSGNLLPNSGFERNADNWRVLWNQHNIQPHVLVRDLSGPYWIPTGLHAIGQYVSTLLPQGAHIVAVAEPIPVEPGKTYCFAGHIAQHRCDSGLGIRFLNADYTELLSEPTNLVAGAINGGPNIADWRRVHVSGVAPAGAVWAQPAHWMRGREQANPFAWLCMPMFCELADGQTEPPPYAPGGNEMAGDFASEVQRINSIHAAVTDPATGLARAHGRVDDLAQVVADNERTSSQRIINVESSLNTVRNGAGGGNLLRNSTFERDLVGWHFWSNNSPAQPEHNTGAPDWQPTGINTLALRSATQPPVGSYAEVYSEQAPVSGGETVAVSLHAAAHRCTARAWIIGKRADGSWTTAHHIGDSTASGGADLRNWTRISGVLQLPPDTRWVQLMFRQEFATAADPVAWMCQPMLCRVLPGATDAPPYSPGGSEYAQAVLELKTEVDTAKNERRAIAGLYVNANGKIGGFRTISDGVTARFDVSADIFTVTSDAAQGLEWQAGCLRSYSGVSQAVLGHGFGEANDLALYVGPNTGRAAARKQDATLWADTAGNAGFSGVVHGAVISGSALTLESLRIRVGDGKYAPFTICDTASDFVNHTAGTRVMTSTCSGFVAPDNGTGYHHKRFGRHRQDVQMHINLHTDHGWEDVVLEVQYNGGSWQAITHTSIDGGYRNSATYLVRYTTIDNWQTVAFRARTVRGKTTCLTLRIDIANYNESGNPPGSHSNMFSPGGTGGQTPPPPPPPPREPRPPRNGIWEQEP